MLTVIAAVVVLIYAANVAAGRLADDHRNHRHCRKLTVEVLEGFQGKRPEFKSIDPKTYRPGAIKSNETFFDPYGQKICYEGSKWVPVK